MRDVLWIETERLTLRPVETADCARIAQFAGDWDVARMLAMAPHPYPPVAAEGWLMILRARASLGEDFVFAIDLPGEGLIGLIGLHARAGKNTIGYWIGKPYWGRGYATEALKAFVAEAEKYGELHAEHFLDNPASARVLQKAGFSGGGDLRALFSLARGVKAPGRALRRAPDVKARAQDVDATEACLA